MKRSQYKAGRLLQIEAIAIHLAARLMATRMACQNPHAAAALPWTYPAPPDGFRPWAQPAPAGNGPWGRRCYNNPILRREV